MMSLRLRNVTLLLTFAFVPFAGFAQVSVPDKYGKGIRFVAADSSFSTRISARLQTLYTGAYDLDSDDYSDGISIRRLRLKFEGFAFDPKLEYKIQLGFANSDTEGIGPANSNTSNIVLDAVAKWNFAPGFSLSVGQTKLPGNREQLVSSQKLQFVDRSLLNSRYTTDRDIGIQLQHESAIGEALLIKTISVSMGEGRNITTGNQGGYDYTGRLELLPFGEFQGGGDYVGSDISREPSPKLSLGVAYDYNTDASRERGQRGTFFAQSRDLKTLFADAMFKYRGFSAMAEYADKQSSGSPVVTTDLTGNVTQSFFTGTGFNVQAGYLFNNNVELAARYTTIRPEAVTQRDKNTQYTLGLSKYIAGHTLKVQTDVSLLKEAEDLSEMMYRVQLEIGF
ncbi:MAG TPA: porin [Sphingobacteriaceae bacterium]